MDLGKPFRLFFSEFSLALALEQPIATLDETIVRENRNGVMSLEDYFQGLSSSFEMRAECVVNPFSFELRCDFGRLQEPTRSQRRISPARKNSAGVVGGFCMSEHEQLASHLIQPFRLFPFGH